MRFYLLLFVAMLFGCSHVKHDARGMPHYLPPPGQLDDLAKKDVCCDSFKDFEYEPIEIKKTYKYEITNASPKYDFESGESYFVALEVPDYTIPLKVKIQSYLKQSIFHPVVTMLNKDHGVIASFDQKHINVYNRERFNRAFIIGNVEFPEVDTKVKYLLIHTTKELLQSADMVRMDTSSPLIQESIAGSYYVHKGSEGKIAVRVLPVTKKKSFWDYLFGWLY